MPILDMTFMMPLLSAFDVVGKGFLNCDVLWQFRQPISDAFERRDTG